jgi:hypothetical protein
MTVNVTGTAPVTLATPASGTYVANSGATLVLEAGTAPGSSIVDDGGTVAINPCRTLRCHQRNEQNFHLERSR